MTTVTSVTPVTCDSVTHPFKGVTCHARSGHGALKTRGEISNKQDVCSTKGACSAIVLTPVRRPPAVFSAELLDEERGE